MKNASDFVDIAEVIPDAIIDLRYAGTRHPFGPAFYPVNRAFLRPDTARKLERAAALLRARGLRLVVWDAYRPLSVQRAMWERLRDERFVAPPERGSRHNRGAAVDVTLAGMDGGEVPMPTDFDDFTDRAHASDTNAPEEARENRDVLQGAMLEAGFTGIDEEWWHFDDPEYSRYPLCDAGLESLAGGLAP